MVRKFFKVLIEKDGDLKEKWIEHYESNEPIKFNDVIVAFLKGKYCFTDNKIEDDFECEFCNSLAEEIIKNTEE